MNRRRTSFLCNFRGLPFLTTVIRKVPPSRYFVFVFCRTVIQAKRYYPKLREYVSWLANYETYKHFYKERYLKYVNIVSCTFPSFSSNSPHTTILCKPQCMYPNLVINKVALPTECSFFPIPVKKTLIALYWPQQSGKSYVLGGSKIPMVFSIRSNYYL